jgi:hypothetical protein
VHHRIPLDFAHFFPALDINRADNLVAVEPRVHRLINKVWSVYPKRAGAGASSAEVDAVEKIINRNFGQWYSNPRNAPASGEMLTRAAQSALGDLEVLLSRAGK